MTKETDLPEEHILSEENEEPAILESPTEEIPEVSGEEILDEKSSDISGADAVPPSPEPPTPQEPPKKETFWSKHKGKIITGVSVAFAVIGSIAFTWDKLKESASVDTDSTPEFPENSPTGTPEILEPVVTSAVSQNDFSENAFATEMELRHEDVSNHLRLLHEGQSPSPEKKAELEAAGYPLSNGNRNYTTVNKFGRDVQRPVKKDCSQISDPQDTERSTT